MQLRPRCLRAVPPSGASPASASPTPPRGPPPTSSRSKWSAFSARMQRVVGVHRPRARMPFPHHLDHAVAGEMRAEEFRCFCWDTNLNQVRMVRVLVSEAYGTQNLAWISRPALP